MDAEPGWIDVEQAHSEKLNFTGLWRFNLVESSGPNIYNRRNADPRWIDVQQVHIEQDCGVSTQWSLQGRTSTLAVDPG